MNRETYISIPQPCHENWDEMSPQDKGRFCDNCAKTVVDFSQMSDTQVLKFLSQSNNRLCGRFARDQIERPLIPFRKERKKIWWMAVLMPLMLLLNKANGQYKAGRRIDKVKWIGFEQTMGLVAVGSRQSNNTVQNTGRKVITGTIINNDSIPIVGASIMLKGTTIGTTSDSLGKFILRLSANKSSAKLIINALGYEEEEFHCSFKDTREANINIKLLQLTPALMGDVVVVNGNNVKHSPIKRINKLNATVRKILRTNPFKVGPNPAIRGTAVHIEAKKEGHYSIQLLDANSKMIINNLFDAVKGATTTTITIPSSVASGMYYISLVNDDTKQQYIEKIIVQ